MSMDEKLPRVLVIASTPFSKTANNGKTLSSFFEGYPREQVAQFTYSGGDSNADVCDHYYIFTKDDVLAGRQGAAYRADEIEKPQTATVPTKPSLLRRIFHVFSQARNPVAVYLKNRVWNKADYTAAYAWIEAFAPDVVFFQGFSMVYGYDFALSVCKKYRLPLILELTDDYTHRLYPLSIVEAINNKRYMAAFTEAIGMAHKTIVISDLMKEEYQRRFGGDMDVMMNAVATDRVAVSDTSRDTLDYVYAGNLLLNRWKVLRNLGRALMQVQPEAHLNIYTPDIPPQKILKALSKVPTIHYGGRLSKAELEARLSTCGHVVHVEAFDKKNRKITRLSMSTKISEYVASGAQVLAIGPSDVASMRCLADNRLGLCVHNPSVAAIAAALAQAKAQPLDMENANEFLRSCASGSNAQRIRTYLQDSIKQ